MSSYNQPVGVREADPKMPWNSPDPVGTYDCCQADMFEDDPVALHPNGKWRICDDCLSKYVLLEAHRMLADERENLAEALAFDLHTAQPPEPPEDPNRP